MKMVMMKRVLAKNNDEDDDGDDEDDGGKRGWWWWWWSKQLLILTLYGYVSPKSDFGVLYLKKSNLLVWFWVCGGVRRMVVYVC